MRRVVSHDPLRILQLIEKLSGLKILAEVPWRDPIEEYTIADDILRDSLRQFMPFYFQSSLLITMQQHVTEMEKEACLEGKSLRP